MKLAAAFEIGVVRLKLYTEIESRRIIKEGMWILISHIEPGETGLSGQLAISTSGNSTNVIYAAEAEFYGNEVKKIVARNRAETFFMLVHFLSWQITVVFSSTPVHGIADSIA